MDLKVEKRDDFFHSYLYVFLPLLFFTLFYFIFFGVSNEDKEDFCTTSLTVAISASSSSGLSGLLVPFHLYFLIFYFHF